VVTEAEGLAAVAVVVAAVVAAAADADSNPAGKVTRNCGSGLGRSYRLG
jgi:hypothetical protein